MRRSGLASPNPTRAALAALAALVVLGASRPGLAGEHTNLEEGLPVEVIDAYPLEFLARELQARLHYEYGPGGEHQAVVEPSFELGVPYNGQLALKVPLVTSFETRQGETAFHLGRVSLDFLYGFNQETLAVPAFAVVLGVEAPDTRDGGSFDPFVRLVLTKMIPGSALWHRIHLNALFQLNVAREEDERAWRYMVAVGYDVRIAPMAILVLDAVRDQPLDGEPAENFGELGVRFQLTPLAAMAIGGGAGATDQGEVVARATVGFQWFAF